MGNLLDKLEVVHGDPRVAVARGWPAILPRGRRFRSRPATMDVL